MLPCLSLVHSSERNYMELRVLLWLGILMEDHSWGRVRLHAIIQFLDLLTYFSIIITFQNVRPFYTGAVAGIFYSCGQGMRMSPVQEMKKTGSSLSFPSRWWLFGQPLGLKQSNNSGMRPFISFAIKTEKRHHGLIKKTEGVLHGGDSFVTSFWDLSAGSEKHKPIWEDGENTWAWDIYKGDIKAGIVQAAWLGSGRPG